MSTVVIFCPACGQPEHPKVQVKQVSYNFGTLLSTVAIVEQVPHTCEENE